MDSKTIVKRFDALVSDRKTAEEAWDMIERFIMPMGGGKFFQSLTAEGEVNWRQRQIFDDTAILGCSTLAASIHGSLTSPAVKWFDLRFRNPDLNRSQAAKEWLEEGGNETWHTIQDSNFNLEVAEGYLDMVGFGTMGIFHQPINDLTWEGMTFDAVPLREFYFEENANGDILRFYRLFQWRPQQIIDKFGADNVPEHIKKKAEDSATNNRMDVIFCIYPIEANSDSNTDTILTIDKRPFGTKYVLKEGGEQLGEVGGLYEMPAYVVRWRRTSGSQWGFGPGVIALSTVLTLNEMIKLVLEAAEKVIDPATLVQKRGLLSDLDLSPGGQTVVKDVGMVVPYESGARFDVSALQVSDLRMMIRRLFHVDQLELKESPAMSATEVMVRYELMNRLLGPTMGRVQNDLLDKLVTNTFKMLYRAGQISQMPDEVAEAGGIVDIEYVGPLSRAQKMDEVAATERWLGNIATLGEMFPEALNVPNIPEISTGMADTLDIPAKYINDRKKIDQLNAKDDQIRQLQGALAAREQESQIQKNEAQAQQAAGGSFPMGV